MTDVEVKPDVERYADLDPEVRKMLEELRKEEVQFLQKMIRTMVAFGTVGKFLCLVGGALLGFLVGIPLLIDTLMRIAGWLHVGK